MAHVDTFSSVFALMKPVFRRVAPRLTVTVDTAAEYTLCGKTPSPFPQHKGKPMCFGSVRMGKAYVSVHLVPLYMNAALTRAVSPALKKRMQGKACFNFKTDPGPEMVAELRQLADAGFELWRGKKWL